jgi:hypothetical protein
VDVPAPLALEAAPAAMPMMVRIVVAEAFPAGSVKARPPFGTKG